MTDRATWLTVAIGGWIAFVILLTVPGNPWEPVSEERVLHAIPFEELVEEYHDDDPDVLTVVAEMAANLLLLLPLGVLVPLRWPAMAGIGRVLAGAVLFSLTIEALQFGLGLGRRSSATDVLLNTVGAGLGFVTFVVVWRRRRSGMSSIPRSQRT